MDFRLEPFFLHKRGLLVVASEASRERIARTAERAAASALGELFVDTAFAEAAARAIADGEIKPLRNLLLHGEAKPGALIWEEAAFYFKSAQAFEKFEHGDREARALFHTRLDEFGVDMKGTFSPEHVIGAASAPGHLEGKRGSFVFGYIDSVDAASVELRPLLIGRRVLTGDFALPLAQSLWVAPERIRQFSKLASIDPKKVDVRVLRDVPERTLKEWFADIVGEPFVEKDWGGEQSDLWTPRLIIDDEPVRAAFLFKGPAAFHPMGIADLGKNGDQIDRVFNTPADLVIVQHCHYIKAQVVHMLEAYASDFRRMRRFSTIDGIVTCQILRAYGKI
jgi:hypothetical protein